MNLISNISKIVNRINNKNNIKETNRIVKFELFYSKIEQIFCKEKY